MVNQRLPRDFSALKGLSGIPDALVKAHLKLYEGYVRNYNLLLERLKEQDLKSPEWSEMKRRVGFEINGLRLHELYFDNLVPGGKGPPGPIQDALETEWNSFAGWRKEFSAMGTMRGVGWVILYRDPVTATLSNHWIDLHDTGHPAGFTPLLVMDVWEHAFTGLERPAYVESFLANADWSQADLRLRAAAAP